MLKWIDFNSLWIVFKSLHKVFSSQLEGLVTWCFPSRELPWKQELVVDRGQLVSLFAVQSANHCSNQRATVDKKKSEGSYLRQEKHLISKSLTGIPTAPDLPSALASCAVTRAKTSHDQGCEMRSRIVMKTFKYDLKGVKSVQYFNCHVVMFIFILRDMWIMYIYLVKVSLVIITGPCKSSFDFNKCMLWILSII